MPIYEFECPKHGVFEVLLPRLEGDIHRCTTKWCRLAATFVFSRVTMKPDPHWNGTFTPNGKYVTSSKQYNAEMAGKELLTRETKEYVEKKKRTLQRDKVKRIKEKVGQIVSAELDKAEHQ